jgi:asparagine synthase (glutamine-hydrolysing)
MCGITGIIGLSSNRVSLDEIRDFTRHLRHRGPDGEGAWISTDATVGLGHARLSILDPSPEAAQPMEAHEGRHLIVFNGEIYNFLELAETLKERGYDFRTRCDTEVLLHGWDCWGTGLFARLNGMWAMAIHDTVSRETILCRDRYGVKPLYYCRSDDRILFASEVQAIDKMTRHSLSLDPRFFGDGGRLDLSEGSYLAGVPPLCPGHFLRVSPGGMGEQQQWYSLSPVEVPRSFPDQAEALKELIIDSCRLRLRSDVPVATCLSGGIDSGTIVGFLHSHSKAESRFPGFNHRSFTAAFPGSEIDESEAARSLAKKFHVQLDVKEIEAPDPDLLETALAACDGPMPTLSFYPIWSLYRHIRKQGIAVTLDGMGPDEMLGGYYIGHDALLGAWQMRSPLWFCDLYRTYRGLYRHGPEMIRNDLKSLLRRGGSRAKRAALAAMHPGATAQSPRRDFPLTPPPSAVPADHPMAGNQLEMALWNQFFVSPLPYFLQQYDRCSMANGVECRTPFLDYRLVEYLFSLPLSSRIGHGYTKRVLRAAAKEVLPDPIRLNRRKAGFCAPYLQWLRGPLKEWAFDITASVAFLESDHFDGHRRSKEIRGVLSREDGSFDEIRIWFPLHLTWWVMQRQTPQP